MEISSVINISSFMRLKFSCTWSLTHEYNEINLTMHLSFSVNYFLSLHVTFLVLVHKEARGGQHYTVVYRLPQ